MAQTMKKTGVDLGIDTEEEIDAAMEKLLEKQEMLA